MLASRFAAAAACALVALIAAPSVVAQPATPQPAVVRLTQPELEELLGPIALYPDDLLANVLAASVYPEEVRQAAGLVARGGDQAAIDGRDWERPVKAVAKAPDVIKMMGDFMDWTVALGQAYLSQAQDVMNAVQSLRRQAQASGALQSSDELTVTAQGQTIYIESAEPQVIYVPSYDPAVVYVDDDSDEWAAGVIGFSIGVWVGSEWDDLDCDWDDGCVNWGDDIDIDIDEINIGDGERGQRGDRVEHHARPGQEGSPWSPNREKPIATSQPDRMSNYKGAGAGAERRASTPRTSSGARTVGARPSGPAGAGAGARPGAQPAGARQPAARPPAAAPRTPPAPSRDRAQTAYNGGQQTRANSSRGASSRQSASRSGAGRSAPARSGGRSGGGRGGRR
jgi:hypothetical protein